MNAPPSETAPRLTERPRAFGLIASLLENPARAPWLLALATALLLLPFLSRAFNIDEPLFMWTAAHVQAHPANPYGFKVNWDNRPQPMWEITKNPPGAAYYLALAAMLFGWQEVGLHIAFLLPAIAAVVGLYFVAGKMCRRPALAAVAMLAMPVFLLSSTTNMCDVMMLALWLWSLYSWLRGLEQRKHHWLALAALLAAASALTKYFGIALVPLLAFYTLVKRRRFDPA